MKVLFVGAYGDMNGVPPPDSMEAHVLESFEYMGHECEYFAYKTAWPGARINRWIELACSDLRLMESTWVDRRLYAVASRGAPDMVLTLLGNYTAPRVIRRLKQITGAPIVCWCQDHMGTLGRQYLIGSHYDYIFCKDRILVDRLQRYCRGGQVEFLPEACNPRVHRPMPLSDADRRDYECEVMTAATLYYYRSSILECLKDKDLRIYGSLPRFYDGPMREFHQGREVYCDEKVRAFRAAKIVVNTLFPVEIGGINARAFEVAGAGAFQLMTESPEIERYFLPGKEIETFSNIRDLKEKVEYYLAHDEERMRIGEAAWRRAHADHTYEARLEVILKKVFSC